MARWFSTPLIRLETWVETAARCRRHRVLTRVMAQQPGPSESGEPSSDFRERRLSVAPVVDPRAKGATRNRRLSVYEREPEVDEGHRITASPMSTCGCKSIGGLEPVPGGSTAKINQDRALAVYPYMGEQACPCRAPYGQGRVGQGGRAHTDGMGHRRLRLSVTRLTPCEGVRPLRRVRWSRADRRDRVPVRHRYSSRRARTTPARPEPAGQGAGGRLPHGGPTAGRPLRRRSARRHPNPRAPRPEPPPSPSPQP